jgi:dihydroflavonol-4-reductase
MDAVIAIPTEPLGAGDDSFTPPTQMMIDFLCGKTPAYIDCVLNFVPVDGLADGLIAAAERGESGKRYVLGGDNVSLDVLLQKLEALTGRKMPKTKLPYWVAYGAGFIETKVLSRLTGSPPKAPLTGVRLAGRQVEFGSELASSALDWKAPPFDDALNSFLKWAKDRSLY